MADEGYRGDISFHTIISANALIHLLLRYDLDAVEHCILLDRGINDTYLVILGADKYILRLYRGAWRSRQAIDAEVMLIERCAEFGLPVSTPIRDRGGTAVQTFSAPGTPRYAVLYSYAEGEPLDRQREEDLALLGRFTADLHQLSVSLPAGLPRPRFDIDDLLIEPLAHLQTCLRYHPDLFDELASLGTRLISSASRLVRSAPAMLIHGDLQCRNVHIDRPNRITVFDFDFCGYGTRCFEFGSVLRDVGGFNNIWNAFIDAYSASCPLSEAERAVIPSMWAIRGIWELGLQAQLVHELGYKRVMRIIEYEVLKLRQWVDQHCDLD
jgi:Ser/Thr protein kinase RdoA (MazF antagonist)